MNPETSIEKRIRTVITCVWHNSNDKQARYIPKAYNELGPGWGVWDKRHERYVEDEKLHQIDPDETIIVQ